MIQTSKILGVAVSAGVDSMVLLDICKNIRDVENVELIALHYNHKWRKESSLDYELLKKYCNKEKIKLIYEENTSGLINDEEVARDQRYTFFKKAAIKYKIDFIFTAHHKNDLVETILFRLARGTGPKGLMPIKEIFSLTEKTNVIRPLLDITKDQIYNYASVNKVPYLEDKTNDNLKYKRNLIRKKIVPLLEEINKNAQENILVCSDLIYSQNLVLDEYFKTLLERISFPNESIKRKEFLSLNRSVQKSFLYWLLSKYELKGNLSKIDSLLKSIIDESNVTLSKDYELKVLKESICFEEKDSSVKLTLNSKDKSLICIKGFQGKSFNGTYPLDKEKKAFVDISNYRMNQLITRNRMPKDIFQPLGFSRGIKLKNYLINKKISLKERYNLPLLCFKNEVLWIPGYSISEKIKVEKVPTHILMLKDNDEKRKNESDLLRGKD